MLVTQPICCPVLGHNHPFMLPAPRGYTGLAPRSRDLLPGAWLEREPTRPLQVRPGSPQRPSSRLHRAQRGSSTFLRSHSGQGRT